MKHAPKHLLVAGLLAALGLSAVAQTSPTAPAAGPGSTMSREGPGHGDPAKAQERAAHMQERIATRLAALKEKLKLSPAQELAWTTYTAALKPIRFERPDRAEFAKLTTPERIDRMRARRAERISEMDKRGEATKAFYATLSPEQKKVFDTETLRGGGRGQGGRHWHHHQG